MKKFKLWWIAAAFLLLTFVMTSGSGVYRFISMVDMFIYFIYFNILVIVGLIVINVMVTSKLSLITSLPSFLTKNFLIETIADEIKERGIEKANEFGSNKFERLHKKSTAFLEKFSLFTFFKDLFIYSGAAVLAHMLVSKYFVADFTLVINYELLLLLGGNALFIFYYFYDKTNLSKIHERSEGE